MAPFAKLVICFIQRELIYLGLIIFVSIRILNIYHILLVIIEQFSDTSVISNTDNSNCCLSQTK